MNHAILFATPTSGIRLIERTARSARIFVAGSLLYMNTVYLEINMPKNYESLYREAEVQLRLCLSTPQPNRSGSPMNRRNCSTPTTTRRPFAEQRTPRRAARTSG